MKNPFRFARLWRCVSFSRCSTKGLPWPNPLLCYRDSRRNRWLLKSFAISAVASCSEFTCVYWSSSLCPSFTSFSRTLVARLLSSSSSYCCSQSPLCFSWILQSLASPLRFVCFWSDRHQLTRSRLPLRRRLLRMFGGRSDRSPNRRNGWRRVLGWRFTVMAMFTRGSFTKGGARGAAFTTTTWVGGTKAIGLTRSMMGMA